MAGVRFIHTADWQIGMPSDFLSERASLLIEEARFEAIELMRDIANEPENELDFVVVCGDIFDDSRIGKDLIDRTLGIISLFDCPVYAIAGNHEVKGGENILESDYLLGIKPENLHILTEATVDKKTGVELIPAPVTGTHEKVNALATTLGQLAPSEKIRIALGHGRVDSVAYSGDSTAIISTKEIEDLIKSKQLDYVALGDRHSFTDIGSSGKFFYSGSPEATDFNEVAAGRYILVEIPSKGKTIAKDEVVGKWTLARIGKPTDRFQIRGAASVESLKGELEKFKNKAKTAIKLYLDIDTDPTTYSKYEDLRQRADKQFATVVVRDGNEREVTPIISGDPTEEDIPPQLAGYLRDAYEDLFERATTQGPDQLVALQALRRFKGILERAK
jgi:DNA repair exonuclease SbcCD nuclease subunit